jgi:PAS domain S-box-containing protein
VLGLGLLLVVAAASAQGMRPARLHVVAGENYPPYLFKGPDGQPQGLLVDLWALWERKTGVPVRLEATQWARAQQMVQDGGADVIDMIFRTPAREPFYSFSMPYAELPVAIYHHDSIQGIQSVRSLAPFRIGVLQGDACAEFLRGQGVADLVPFPDYQRLIDAVRGQQLKLFCMDQYPADFHLYRNQLHRDYPKAFDLYQGHFHRAVRRGREPLLAFVEAGMVQITASEREALQRKWLHAPTDWRAALLPVLVVLGGLLLAAALLGLWVRALRRAVKDRTEALAQEQARVSAVIRSIPDLVWLKNPEGVYLACNQAFEGLYGAPEQAIVGHTDRDFVDAATADAFRLHDRQAMASDRPHSNEEWLTFASDGRTRLFETIKSALRDAHGQPIGVLGVARDITERKKVTEELGHLRNDLQLLVQERTAQLEQSGASLRQLVAQRDALLQAAPVGIAVLHERRVQLCNRRMEDIFGVSQGQMQGASTRDWYVDDNSFEQMAQVYGPLFQGQRVSRGLLMRRRAGQVFWARLHAQAIDPAEPERGVVVVLEDVTAEHEAAQALRLARDQAEAATKLKSAFLANISHEVRTPLNAILGMAHLAEQAGEDTQRRDHLRHVQAAGRHLLRLFNDLLDLSRFEAGGLHLDSAPFGLHAVLDPLQHLVAPRAHERGLGLRFETPPELPPRLVGDAQRLSQLLLIYLDNAFKFTDHGEVVLRVSVREQLADRVRLHFAVADTGPGIAPEQQRRLFKDFEQGDGSATRAQGGLGLGLSMAREIARLMDGELGVDSVPGQGSRFWFSAWFGMAPSAEPRSPRALRVQGLRALVAVADAGVSDSLVAMLKGFGLEVGTAVSGPDVLRRVNRAQQIGLPLDFVFADAALPQVDGWRTARMLQALELAHPLHLLVLGEGDLADVTERVEGVGVLPLHAGASRVWDAMVECLAHAQPGAWLEPPRPTGPVVPIDGIDTEAGLRHCEGRAEVYEQTVLQFLQHQAPIQAQLHAADRDTVLRALHLLKNQAPAVGALRLQSLAAGVELALAAHEGAVAEGGGPDLPGLVALEAELRHVATRLPQLLARRAAPAPLEAGPPSGQGDQGDQGGWGDLVAELAQRLGDGDVEALALSGRHQATLGGLLGERLPAWQAALAAYDFDAGLALLREAAAARGLRVPP